MRRSKTWSSVFGLEMAQACSPILIHGENGFEGEGVTFCSEKNFRSGHGATLCDEGEFGRLLCNI